MLALPILALWRERWPTLTIMRIAPLRGGVTAAAPATANGQPRLSSARTTQRARAAGGISHSRQCAVRVRIMG
jgi:hypothetical protein